MFKMPGLLLLSRHPLCKVRGRNGKGEGIVMRKQTPEQSATVSALDVLVKESATQISGACVFNDHGKCYSARANPECNIALSPSRCIKCKFYSNIEARHKEQLRKQIINKIKALEGILKAL